MEPWYKIVQPRKEVREGRSFHPDEFAIALEQVVAGTAPEDYRDPKQFFSRTCFTQALNEHAGMVLRRLAGRTENTAPVLSLVTQFGGGKTHTLTALYHIVRNGQKPEVLPGVSSLMEKAGLDKAPRAKVAVFVGNAWDPEKGRETPWIDLARQLAGAEGVEALGSKAKTSPPGTESLQKVFKKAGAPVLILFDEVLNFMNRHRDMTESFYAFIDNVTRAMTGTTEGAAVVSLPRSQIEMTDWDMKWQDRITKTVKRVAKDLVGSDEAEISDVIRRRLFESLGDEKTRSKVAKTYADWCFDRRAQLPPEWTAVDTSSTDAKAKEFLRKRFEACYPFHPAALSVFQRKWQVLPHYQQTRGTLAMLAQWISCAFQEGYQKARKEALITLGSAPLDVPAFKAVVLGQAGESRLSTAIDTDIASEHSHARALDVDTSGPLSDIHRRVGTTIFFESSGGQADKVAHLPELRFALGEPRIETTSIDNAAMALEARGFFISSVGTDGYKIYHKANIKKAMNDRRASLDEETEIKPAIRKLVKEEFEKDKGIPMVFFPDEGSAVPDTPKLTVVVMSPEEEWTGEGPLRDQVKEWMIKRGKDNRLYPGALIWCIKKQGRQLREKAELWLAWKRVENEVKDGTLGSDYDKADKSELAVKVRDIREEVIDEIWSGYRYLVLADSQEIDGLRVIDLGEGHSSEAQSLSNKIVTALRSRDLLNLGVGAGYIDRHWPPALKGSGEWPLASLRQSFLNGSMTRLLDPDAILKRKLVEFVENGDFGLASGKRLDGTYERLWFKENLDADEVSFAHDVYLIKRDNAEALKKVVVAEPPKPKPPEDEPGGPTEEPVKPEEQSTPGTVPQTVSLRLTGTIPPEVWNRLGNKLISKLKQGDDLELRLELSVTVDAIQAEALETDLLQALDDLGLIDKIKIEKE